MINLLHVEFLKIKRICLWIPVVAAFFLLFMTGGFWYMNYREGPGGLFSAFSVMYFFLAIIFLLSATIIASIQASNEHENNMWNLLNALPVSKMKIYLNKVIVIYLLLLFEVLLIILGTSIIWMLVSDDPVPWDIVIKQPLYCFLASLAVINLQIWISIRFVNQSVPIGVGVFGSIASLFLARSNFEYFKYLPWSYPALSTPLIPDHFQWVIFGILTGGVLLILGTLHFTRLEW
ncbi:ABC transporter permease [Bacillus sp. Bva_UNVM-123]|uniref:ABC transporter permease n=1 Tax=Bacillus sp. Bva_UNVM-123 TaxID=2829798 RepID=UPI00391F5AA3